MKTIKLFCIPYAGGSSMIYNSWKKLMHSSIEIIPVEIAGRGRRMGAPFYTGLATDGTEDLYQSIEKYLDGSPFAIFGHSMGTLFSYELSHRIHQKTGQFPAHLFLSGRGAPHIKKTDKIVHNLPDSEFQSEIMELGGTPSDLFDNKDLRDIYMPILRSDYRLVETYEVDARKLKVDCDITALWGNEDKYIREDAEAWQEYTHRNCKLVEFAGGHFFINQFQQQIVDVIYQTLTSEIGSRGSNTVKETADIV